MEFLLNVNSKINNIVWGWPMLVLLIGIGIFFTAKLKIIQVNKFNLIMKKTLFQIFKKHNVEGNEITPFEAVATALAATVGTGNISGVAIAIASGGPGAIFWMWLSAFFGMATKFSEVVLAIVYREKTENGEYNGGPMYYIKNGLGLPKLAKIFSLLTVLASFGIGNMTQSNSITRVLEKNFGLNIYFTSIILFIIVSIVLLGGVQRVAKVSSKLVPFMAFFYIVGGVIILIINYDKVLPAFQLIFSSAFTKQAAIGGFSGAGIKEIMRQGIARGVFTNEAGLGSAPIVHASAKTDHPVLQGMWGIFEVFMDTIIICTLTALVIITSGKWNTGLSGSALTSEAFSTGIIGGGYIVAIGLTLFAFSTILGWSFYGEKAIEFLFGKNSIKIYRIVYVFFVVIGGIGGLQMVWQITDTLNGLMAVPNLIALILLYKSVVKMVNHYFENPHMIVSEDNIKEILK